MRRLLVMVLLALPCALPAAPRADAPMTEGADDMVLQLQPLPATFAGTLPCADCPGIRYQLNLFADHTYHLRTEYVGKEPATTADDIGQWAVQQDERRLVLQGNRERRLRFTLKDASRLRKLDLEGKEITSILNYDLVREPAFLGLEPRLRVRGMYRYLAGAAVLRECVTGRQFAVPLLGANLALQQAYLEARRESGEELLVDAEVRIVARPRTDGTGADDAVDIERFNAIWPGETCGTPAADADFTNTHWRLVRLGREPVVKSAEHREPHLRFLPEENRVQGATGCNRIIGSYERSDAGLRFGAVATTRMACGDDAEQEQALLQALEATRRFTITGSHLELLADDGRLLARFEATHF